MNSELRTQNFGISGYHLTEKLYESNSSLVYRGYREADKQPVVLKILQEAYPTPERFAWFKREYQVTRNLNLAGVVKAYGFFREQQCQVMVLEDFGGDSLARLEVAGKLELGEFLHLAIAITQILDQIHAAQIIHKDINPSNIVLNPTTKVVKIIDFGISTVLSRENPTFCHPHLLEGTLPYISPEQTGRMNRAIDYRSDFYSLGVTFYKLLTGRLPFVSDDPLELVNCHLAKQPPPLVLSPKGEIPEVIGEIVLKLMEKNPEDCYQSAYGIQADLESCLHQLQTKNQIDFFPLGSHDISDQFNIPQKLYGREGDVETLLAAFERVAGEMGRHGDTETRRRGDIGRQRQKNNSQFPSPLGGIKGGFPNSQTTNNNTEIILVSGYSGVGKSALVNEIHKPITAKRGNFIAGKFDQYQRNIPYSAISQAFNQLCNHLLSESTATFKEWQEKILAAVGNNGQVLIDVIPNLELVIGQQPAVATVGLQEAQNRFNLVCRNFIQAVCQPEHPLVLFIDDLQWVDGASLSLIRTIMSSPEIHHLLIIGAYRDNEVDISHPLMITLEEIKQQSGRLSTIHLENLANSQVNTLIAEALACNEAACQPLTDLVYAKAQGNPFFTIEFLLSLYTEGLLSFNPTKRSWQWDLSKIQGKNITENVVELMVEKISHLPETTQAILELAACLGNTFDLSTLAIISQDKPAEVLTDLFPALQEGLVVPLNKQYKLIEELETAEVRFKFLHDRVQQAAYYLIAENQRQVIHLQIGRLLYDNMKTAELEEQIFEIANHFNQSIALIKENSEKITVTELNLLAGKTAKDSNGYSSAVNYLTTGLALLTEDSWLHQYELTLNLHLEAVEAEYLNTNYERAEILTDIVLQNVSTILDKVKVYTILILSYSAQNQMQQAIDTGLQVLELLGVSLTQSPPPKLVIEDLYHLPEMTEPDKQAAMQILMMLFAPVYTTNPSLLPSISWTMVDLCLRYGNCRLAAYAYGLYGLLLCGVLGDIEAGYKFGKLALQVLAKFEAREIHCRIYNKFYSFIIHWKEDAHRSLLPLTQDTIQVGLETGEIEFACYATVNYCANLVLLGESLESVQQQHLQYLSLISSLKQEFQLYYTQIWGQFVLNLLNQATDKQLLIGEIFNEQETLPILQANHNLSSLYCLYLTKAMLCYLFKDYGAAATNAALAAQYESGIVGLFPSAYNPFYYSLALLALYPTATSNEQQEYLEKVAANQEQLQIWANHAPLNFQHKYELVAAERARVLGQNWEATEFYEQAIKGARDNKYLQEEALAYELAAEFYLTHSRLEIAASYLTKAHYCYQRWQAWAKVKDLEAKYPQFLLQNTPRVTTTTSAKDTKTTAALDLTSILKASHTLSGEIVIDNLLTKMLKIILENAGAEIGYLLMEKGGEWLIEASAKGRGQEVEGRRQEVFTGNEEDFIVELWQSIPMETVSGSSDIPMVSNAIVNYVIRTQKSVVLNNAAREGNFTCDLYILKKQPKSVLCTPLLHQGKLLGILYLENNLTTEVFTPERLEVLNFLSSQAAISIENAKLYAEVQASESRLNQFLEAMPVGVGVLDKHGRPYYINYRAQELLGKGLVREATADTIAESYRNYIAGTNQLYPSEDLPIVRALQGESITVDDLEIHQEDKIIPAEAWGAPIYDQQGNIAYALVAFQDITERKQAQKLLADYNHTLEEQVAQRTEALRESNQRFRNAFETAAIGMCLLSPDGHFLEVNSSVCQIFGYSEPELLSLSFPDITYPEDLEASHNLARQLLAGKITSYNLQKRYLHKNGQIIWALLSVSLIRNRQQQPLYFITQIQDITEQRQAEAALKESEERYRRIVETSNEGIWLIDGESRTTFVNPKMAQMLGYSIEEMLGMPMFAFMDEEGRNIASKNVQRRRQGISEQHDFKFRCRDGSDLWTIISTTAILDEEGQYLGALGMITDISSRKAMARELALREARLNAFFEAAPIGMLIVDPQLRYVQVNEFLAQINGQPVNEHIGKSLGEVIPDIAPKIEPIYRQVLTTGTPIINQEVRGEVPSQPGVERYWLVSYFPIPDADRGYSGVGGVVVEISAQKQAEQALKESRAQYQSLVDVLPQYLYRTDTQGKITFGNRAFLSTLGMTLAECLGKTVYNLYPQDLADKCTADNQIVMETGVTLDIIETHQAPVDNSTIYVQVIKSPVRDENGHIIGTQGIFWDVTERQVAEETLRWQEALLRSMANTSPLAFYVVDNRTDTILYFNCRFCEIWGLQHLEESMQQGEIKNNDIIPHCLPLIADIPTFAESCKPLQSEENRAIVEDEIAFVDGRFIRRFSAQIRDEQDHYFGRLYIFEDITDRKQAAANLQKALEVAEIANRAKSAFLASTSHELRTPLNAILGFAQLMSHSPHLSSEHQEYIRIIHHSGEHLLSLINDVLDMSKIEAGSMTLKETNFNLYRLLDDLEGMFQLKALEKKLQLVFECSQDVPQYLHIDQLKLRQVLINLLNNAIKFTSEGGVLVRVRIANIQWLIANGKEQVINNEQLAINNQRLAISFEVADTGIGIAPEELDSIFEPFVQAATSQQFQEGTGLGLAISRNFVQLMGGQITVSSQVGSGTIFKFDIPVKLVEATTIETQQPTRRVIALESNQPRYRILIVDDQDYNRQLLVNLLSPLDFELREAGNGQEAVAIWENWQPHLIWMDLRMPVMDGYEATRQIRVRETLRRGDAGTRGRGDGEDKEDKGDKGDKGASIEFSIPHYQTTNNSCAAIPLRDAPLGCASSTQPTTNTIIIALTASSPEAERAVARSAGCDDLIRKPFRESDIFEGMKKYLGVRYIYEEAVSEEKSLVTESDNQGIASPIDLDSQELAQRASILTPATIANLPADWLTNFQQATVEGDLDLMLTLIEQIRQQHHHLANALASLANQFQFEELLALIEG